MHTDGVEMQLQPFLTSKLDGTGHLYATLSEHEARWTHTAGLEVSEEEKNQMLLPGIESLIVQPVTCSLYR